MEQNDQRQVLLMVTLLRAGCLATAVAIFAVALFFVPEEGRSSSFWLRVAWTEFLALLVYGYFGDVLWRGMARAEKQPELKSVLTSATFVLIAYVTLSVWLLFGVPQISANWRILGQTLLTATAVSVFVFLNMARLRAAADFQQHADSLSPVDSLKASLWLHVQRLAAVPSGPPAQAHAALRLFCETLDQSLPRGGHATHLEEYKRFVGQLDDLSKTLQASSPGSLQAADAEQLASTLRDLYQQLQQINYLARL